ncbi:hypothetical protein DMH15_02845 [Streptomyces sp. WAC 06725]|nr:hypothetical protein DMH15_02845 [Streptomyces sp. WAC 06725]
MVRHTSFGIGLGMRPEAMTAPAAGPLAPVRSSATRKSRAITAASIRSHWASVRSGSRRRRWWRAKASHTQR